MYCDVGSDVWSQKKSFFKAQIGLVQESWKENANLLRRLYNKDHYIFWKTCDKKSWKEESSHIKVVYEHFLQKYYLGLESAKT